jgi:quinolinate synthase
MNTSRATSPRETGKEIIYPTREPRMHFPNELNYQMIGWPGRCEVHEKFSVEDIQNVQESSFPTW